MSNTKIKTLQQSCSQVHAYDHHTPNSHRCSPPKNYENKVQNG